MRLVNEQKNCNGNENFYENLFFVFSVNIERIHNIAQCNFLKKYSFTVIPLLSNSTPIKCLNHVQQPNEAKIVTFMSPQRRIRQNVVLTQKTKSATLSFTKKFN